MNASREGQVVLRKKRSCVPDIKGTSVSFQNAHLLTSTGMSALDFHLGGGLIVGTVLLIEEDQFEACSNILLKYFLAEGISNQHKILLASGDTPPVKILNSLPDTASVEDKIPTAIMNELKIAWRYKNQDVNHEVSSSNRNYDLSKIMSSEKIEASNISVWNPSERHEELPEEFSFVQEPYLSLLNKIKCEIEEGHFKTTERDKCRNILRIAISTLGSPMWQSQQNSCSQNQTEIPKFLYALRALLRASFAVACITLSSTLMQDLKLVSRIRKMSDFVIHLEAFMDSEKKHTLMYKDFDGILQILKLPVLNTFIYKTPSTDLAFKCKRKKFVIEYLHLPPDIDDPSASDKVQLACGSNQTLDF